MKALFPAGLNGRVAAVLLLACAAVSSTPAAEFPQGLMLHFNFDEAASAGVIPDRTGRGNNGRVTGAAWTSAGRRAGAYEFVATNSCVDVTNAPSLNLKKATFAAWFKTSKSEAGGRSILGKMPDRGYALGIAGDSTNGPSAGRVRFAVNDHVCLGDSNVTDGAWHHAAGAYDGESLKLYVDGQLQKQVVLWRGEIAAGDSNLTIGMNESCPVPQENGRSFDGAIDELMIFDHALSDAEVGAVVAFVKPKFTKDQTARRRAELKELLDRGLILQDFYDRKVKECEATP